MASPLEEEYPRVIRLKSELETSLADVNYTAVAIARQSAADDRQQQQRVGAAPSVAKQQHLAGLVNALGRQRDQLRQTLRSANLNPQQRSTWTRRLDKLDRDCALLNHSVEKAVGYIAREMVAEQQHADLLDSGGSRLRDRRRNMEVEALVAEERNRLDDTSAALDSMIAQGKATIDNLLHQKGYLKNTVKRMKTAMTSLGVSASLISSVENRLRSDRWITFLGMIIVSTLLYLFFCWWTGLHVFWWFPSRLIMGIWNLTFGRLL